VPAYVPIDDPDDPRVAAYREVRERDLVGRGGRFVAEGEVVLRTLVARSPFALESCLVSQKRIHAVRDLLAALPDGIPIYAAAQPVIDAITGFHIHRGVLALGRRGEPADPAALLRSMPERAIVVGLVGLTNHDNVGGVFRTAAAFGAGAVLLDPATCDPLYRKAIRVSVGASLTIPFARARSADELVEVLAAAGFEVIALSPSGAEPLSAVRPSRRMALLLGTEGPGLPQAILARVRTIRIAMTAGFDSLNVATASGIALHHLATAL
jgi:tRNA G18 (ribose-2'-O)-methylase SpoU